MGFLLFLNKIPSDPKTVEHLSRDHQLVVTFDNRRYTRPVCTISDGSDHDDPLGRAYGSGLRPRGPPGTSRNGKQPQTAREAP